MREYRDLLADAIAAGYAAAPVEAMPAWRGGRTLYLRHDVDVHIEGIDVIADAEAELGVGATYFVPLTLPFNPAYRPNRDVLRRVVALGHRIGLHYDLAAFPETDARQRLDQDAARLSEIVEAPVESIVMHNPGTGGRDLFAERPGPYVHPHAYEGVVYVSDSCRAWRDDTLLTLFGSDPPLRLLLNTHPELWLGDGTESRDAFLAGTLLRHAAGSHVRYVEEEIRRAWAAHPGPALHDAREAR